MMFTDAYTILSNAVVNTVGTVDPNILNQMGVAAFSLQTITTELNRLWLQSTGWNPSGKLTDNPPGGPNVIRIPSSVPDQFIYYDLDGKGTNLSTGQPMSPDDLKNILSSDNSQLVPQLSEAGVQTIQSLISTLITDNTEKQTESGFANTIFSRLQSTLQLETSDPSSLAQQMTSSMNQFSGQPAADVDIFTQGSGIWNSVGSLTQSSF